MADEIVDLTELVPNDIRFVFPDGVELAMPGDVDNETVWNVYLLLLDIAKLDEQYADVKPTDPAAKRGLAEGKKLQDRLQEILLAVFRKRQPDLEELPFGAKSSALVAHKLLTAIGFLEEAPADGPDPTRGSPEDNESGGSSTTGSSRSSRSSGSPRTRGAGSGTGKRSRGST